MKRNRQLFRIFAIAAIILTAAGCSTYGYRNARMSETPPPGASQAILSATGALQEFAPPYGRIPQTVLDKSAGIAMIPSITKAAFLVGGEHGNGVLIRHEKGKWGLPVFVSLRGLSLGFQVGATQSDVVLVFMDPAGIAKIQGGKVNLGADLTVLAGPVGGSGDISNRGADVLAYRRTGGLFIGVALTGSSLSMSEDTTYAYYVRPGESKARGYYGGGYRLDADLLSLKQENLQNVPYDARQLQQKLEQLTAAGG